MYFLVSAFLHNYSHLHCATGIIVNKLQQWFLRSTCVYFSYKLCTSIFSHFQYWESGFHRSSIVH